MPFLKRALNYVLDNSLLLLIGALAGLAWANLGHGSYVAFRDATFPAGTALAAWFGHIDVHFFVNDVLMTFFFAMAGKEVWEAMLPGGVLRTFNKAATPVLCAVGGMAAPAAIYAIGAAMLGQFPQLGRGWAIPCATDIAFSYMIAVLIFGRRHSAVPFLLLLAIADDALGLLVLAVFYPQAPLAPLWLALPVAAVVLGLLMRRKGVNNFWWYLLGPGVMSWAGLALAGIHPALGLLPIIPTLPHGKWAETPMQWRHAEGPWALERLEEWWKNPVEVIVGIFGLVNAGVPLTALGNSTYLVTVGLLLGKPIGIFCSGVICKKLLRLALPDGLTWRELFVVGCAGGIGFTVALFVATAAFPNGPIQDACKMGALLSGLAAVTTLIAAKLMGVRKLVEKPA